MDNQFIAFLNSIDDIVTENSTENNRAKILELSSNRLPAMLLEAYTVSAPKEDTEFEDLVFYGLDRMIDENTNYVPGANLLPLGLFTFASTFDGDSICIDMNDTAFPVYQCSHSLHSGEDDIYYSKNSKMHELPFGYENVIKTAPRLADSFEGFVSLLGSGELQTYSVSDMIARL